VRRLVYCTASFSICSLRRAKFPIIYPVPWLDYKVVTHPFHDANLRMCTRGGTTGIYARKTVSRVGRSLLSNKRSPGIRRSQSCLKIVQYNVQGSLTLYLQNMVSAVAKLPFS
jgi:hypothetical protein